MYFLIEGWLPYRILFFSVKHEHESAIGCFFFNNKGVEKYRKVFEIKLLNLIFKIWVLECEFCSIMLTFEKNDFILHLDKYESYVSHFHLNEEFMSFMIIT